jgi:hypothetical protein
MAKAKAEELAELVTVTMLPPGVSYTGEDGRSAPRPLVAGSEVQLPRAEAARFVAMRWADTAATFTREERCAAARLALEYRDVDRGNRGLDWEAWGRIPANARFLDWLIAWTRPEPQGGGAA